MSDSRKPEIFFPMKISTFVENLESTTSKSTTYFVDYLKESRFVTLDYINKFRI